MKCKDCGISLDGEYELNDERCANCQSDYNKLPKTFILMRFYDGGGLADYNIVSCIEEELYDKCVEFEKECVRQNLGTHIGILKEKELDYLTKVIKEI